MMLTGRFNRRIAAAAGAVAVSFLLFSCSGEGDGGDTSGETASEKVPAGGEGTEAVNTHKGSVADVTFRTLDGSEVKVSDYGNNILYVNYIVTWNEDCKKLIPIMNEVQRKFFKNVTVLGVVTDVKSASQVRAWARTNGVKFDLLLTGGHPGRFGKPNRLPTSHIVTRDNYLLSTFEGLYRAKQYEESILAMYRARM